MFKCDITSTACSSQYTKHKCRCDSCKAWQSDRRKKHYQNNREKELAYAAEFRSENRELQLERQRDWKSKNKARCTELENRRRARKLDQTPDLTADEKVRLRDIYDECARVSEETGVPHHVDHIQPLAKGGLHHPDNLQVITAEENLKKGAKYEL